MLKLLATLPEWALWAIVAAVAAVLLGMGGAGGWAARGVLADKALAEVRKELTDVRTEMANLRAQHAQLVADAAEASRKAEVEARDEETRRAVAAQEIADAERQAKIRRAAGSADLRRTVTGLRDIPPDTFAVSGPPGAEAPAGSGVAFRSPPAAAADLVRWGLYADLADRASDLAIALADSRAAGLACERIHDSLSAGAAGPGPGEPQPGPALPAP